MSSRIRRTARQRALSPNAFRPTVFSSNASHAKALAVVALSFAAHLAWSGVASAQNSVTSATPTSLALAPFKAGERYFFTADSGTLYVREGPTGPTRALLPAKSFGTVAPSRNGKYLAYTLPARANATSYQVHIRDVDTRKDLNEMLDRAVISHAPWTDNHKGFFYAREDPSDHRQRVYYHRVGQPQSRDEALYSRPDGPDWRYDVRVSDDGQYAVFTISHAQDKNTRLYFIDLDNPGKPTLTAPVVKLVDEFGARYEFIDNGGPSFFLTTNRAAPLGRIVVANTDVTREARWPAVIRETTDTLRYARTAGNEFLIAVYQNGNKSIARVYTPPSANEMRAEARRRMDSVRKANGDTLDRGQNGRPRMRGTMGDRDPEGRMPAGPIGLSGFRLDLRDEIPFPAGSTLISMSSVADQDELFYTLKLADGTMQSYIYNAKRDTNAPFNTTTGTIRK
jgi:hypothetical protein